MGEALQKRLKQQKFESSLEEALINVLVTAGHIREFFDKRCSQHGLTLTQYNVLRILRGVYPDGHPRCEIISRMIDRAPDVTRLIDRLENSGLVERNRSDDDRRMSITRITKEGLELIDKIKVGEDLVQHFAERISLQDRRELSRICEGLYVSET